MCWRQSVCDFRETFSLSATQELYNSLLTHCDQMRHIFVNKLSVIASDNGLSAGRRQAIIWTNAGILLIGPFGAKFNDIFTEIHTFSFKKTHFKMAAILSRPQCVNCKPSRDNPASGRDGFWKDAQQFRFTNPSGHCGIWIRWVKYRTPPDNALWPRDWLSRPMSRMMIGQRQSALWVFS